MAGLSLTALLATHGVDVTCVDRDAPPTQLQDSYDGRTTAISYGSQKVLAAAGVWDDLLPHACPIETIKILDGDSPVLLEFDHTEVGNNPFGWIIENRLIRATLFERIQQLKSATHIAPAQITGVDANDAQAVVHTTAGDIHGRLIVGADGRGSFIRQQMGIDDRSWSYKQRAIVCNVEHDNPHNNVAVEHFRPEGPFAILPLPGNRSSVVWTEHGPERMSAVHHDERTFNAGLSARFPDAYGNVRLAGKRFSYPLSLIHAHTYISTRMALVADAAHGIHPIAGQGLNLGFRDIASLCDLIVKADQNGADPGSENLLNTYQRERRTDNMAMAGTTDILTRLFSNNIPPVSFARKMGLRMVSRFKPAKNFFMKQAMGAAGILPDLIRDKEAA